MQGVLVYSNLDGRIINHQGKMLASQDTQDSDTVSPAAVRYADMARNIVAAAQDGVEATAVDGASSNAVRFLRVRTGKYEMMITPGGFS